MENKTIKKILALLFILFFITLFIYFIKYLYINEQMCYYEERILIRQFNHNGSLCDGCLEFETLIPKSSLYYTSNNLNEFRDEFKYLYFMNESKYRNDLNNNESIRIRWCYIDSIKEYRIRGITK